MNNKRLRVCDCVSVTEYCIPITKLPEASGYEPVALCHVFACIACECLSEIEIFPSVCCILASVLFSEPYYSMIT